MSLFLDIHHIINDGVSYGVISERILKALRGEEIPLDKGILESAAYDAGRHSGKAYERSHDRFVNMIRS